MANRELRRRIDRLERRGLDKSQIVSRLTGTRDGGGAARQLGAWQLKYIGFSDNFIQKLGKNTPWTSNGGSSGGSGGNPGQNPAAPVEEEAGFDYDEWRKEQDELGQFRYNQNAADALAALFDTYGLSGLSGRILGMLQ